MAEIFISYSSGDLERAKLLAGALEQEGWQVWWDRRILPGQRFDRVIVDAINQAACVVVMWSKSSVDSDWVREEAEQAKLRECLLPVVIDEVAPPLGFGRIQTGNLIGWTGERDHPGYASLLLALADFVAGDRTTASLTPSNPPAAREDPTPTTVGRYQVQRALGSGSFATVWLAHDPDLDADVAIKVLAENWSLDPDIKRRFAEEARILRRLEHPSITRVYDVGEDQGRPFFVMEYADRGSLLERMERRRAEGRPFGAAEAIAVSDSIAEALEVAHNNGVVHRDLKPSNVLLRSDGSGGVDERMMLADFGIARNLQAASGFTISAGTPHYAAPEQAEGRADARSDIHAAGAVLFELLAGDVPYPYESIGQVLTAQHTTGPPSIAAVRPDVPAALDIVIREAMAADPDQRVPTAEAWRTRLAEIDPEATASPALQPPTVALTTTGPAGGHPDRNFARTAPGPEVVPIRAEDDDTRALTGESQPTAPDVWVGTVGPEPPVEQLAVLLDGSAPDPGSSRKRWWVAGAAATVVAVAVVIGAFVLGGGDAEVTSATSTATTTTPTTTEGQSDSRILDGALAPLNSMLLGARVVHRDDFSFLPTGSDSEPGWVFLGPGPSRADGVLVVEGGDEEVRAFRQPAGLAANPAVFYRFRVTAIDIERSSFWFFLEQAGFEDSGFRNIALRSNATGPHFAGAYSSGASSADYREWLFPPDSPIGLEPDVWFDALVVAPDDGGIVLWVWRTDHPETIAELPIDLGPGWDSGNAWEAGFSVVGVGLVLELDEFALLSFDEVVSLSDTG